MNCYRIHFRTYMAGIVLLRQTQFVHAIDQAYRLIRELRDMHAQYGHTADFWLEPIGGAA